MTKKNARYKIYNMLTFMEQKFDSNLQTKRSSYIVYDWVMSLMRINNYPINTNLYKNSRIMWSSQYRVESYTPYGKKKCKHSSIVKPSCNKTKQVHWTTTIICLNMQGRPNIILWPRLFRVEILNFIVNLTKCGYYTYFELISAG